MLSEIKKLKVLVLGDVLVGKTSFMNRFAFDYFDESYDPTIGIGFQARSIQVDETRVKLSLWDASGQERFRSLISSYCQGCSIAFLVYDTTNRSSFEKISHWHQLVESCTVVVVIGTKSDLADLREVTFEEGHCLADLLKASFIEVSSKTNSNIQLAFKLGASKAMHQLSLVLPSGS